MLPLQNERNSVGGNLDLKIGSVVLLRLVPSYPLIRKEINWWLEITEMQLGFFIKKQTNLSRHVLSRGN